MQCSGISTLRNEKGALIGLLRGPARSSSQTIREKAARRIFSAPNISRITGWWIWWSIVHEVRATLANLCRLLTKGGPPKRSNPPTRGNWTLEPVADQAVPESA